MDNHTITIRRLTVADWQDLRKIRLHALQINRGNFGAYYDDCVKQPPTYWQDMLSHEAKAIFGLFDKTVLIGITGVVPDRDDPSGKTAVMVMSFIDPTYRGRGLSDMLYKARLDFAVLKSEWTTLVIGHRAGNAPSHRAILKHGFKFVNTHDLNWPDGTRDTMYNYTIDLETYRKAR